MHIYTHRNELSLLQNITLNGIFRSNYCLADGFYEVSLKSGVKCQSKFFLLFQLSTAEEVEGLSD